MTKHPAILYFDIETSPMLVYLYNLKQNGYISTSFIERDWFVICWAAKWGDSKEIFSGTVTPAQARRWDDSKILKPLWKLLDQADIVAGHNSDRFDIKKMNTKFVLNNFPKPRLYKTIDTLKIARKYFSFSSNKMDFLNKKFGLRLKDDMNQSDWRACVAGDQKALDKMLKYNKGDVLAVEQLYHRLEDWEALPKLPKSGWK